MASGWGCLGSPTKKPIIPSGEGQARVIHKNYELVCRLPAQVAFERLAALLSKEGVGYKAAGLSLASTRTPIAVIGIQASLYSRSNWVGVNPFAFVSAVEVRCEQLDYNLTRVTVRANRLRALLWVAFWTGCSAIVGLPLPDGRGGILVVLVGCAAWFAMVPFLAGYLLKNEIRHHLDDHP